MNRLSKICDKSLPFIERTLPILNSLPNTKSVHNKHRTNIIDKKSKYTFALNPVTSAMVKFYKQKNSQLSNIWTFYN